jgi:hypothetical protein
MGGEGEKALSGSVETLCATEGEIAACCAEVDMEEGVACEDVL